MKHIPISVFSKGDEVPWHLHVVTCLPTFIKTTLKLTCDQLEQNNLMNNFHIFQCSAHNPVFISITIAYL